MNELIKDLPGQETLDEISRQRVFTVLSFGEEKIILEEGCDEYYEITLNSKMCKDISDYFGELAKRLEGVNGNE